jgi:hypothetical protein
VLKYTQPSTNFAQAFTLFYMRLLHQMTPLSLINAATLHQILLLSQTPLNSKKTSFFPA